MNVYAIPFALVVTALIFLPPIFLLPKFEWGRKLHCRWGWHSRMKGFERTGFDGCSVHAKCKWCEFKGMIDSQGNLF